jgi:Tat protein translocase TatB subunit
VFGIGMTELLVVLVVGLLVLGPKRLPEVARSLGRGMREFRRASSDMRRDFMDATEDARIDPFAEEPAESGAAKSDPNSESTPEKEAAPVSESEERKAEKSPETSGG